MIRRLLQRITRWLKPTPPEPPTAVPPVTIKSVPDPLDVAAWDYLTDLRDATRGVVALNEISPVEVPMRDVWPPALSFVGSTPSHVVWKCSCGDTITQTRGFPRGPYVDLHRPDHKWRN